jgi:hypothetical protein
MSPSGACHCAPLVMSVFHCLCALYAVLNFCCASRSAYPVRSAFCVVSKVLEDFRAIHADKWRSATEDSTIANAQLEPALQKFQVLHINLWTLSRICALRIPTCTGEAADRILPVKLIRTDAALSICWPEPARSKPTHLLSLHLLSGKICDNIASIRKDLCNIELMS